MSFRKHLKPRGSIASMQRRSSSSSIMSALFGRQDSETDDMSRTEGMSPKNKRWKNVLDGVTNLFQYGTMETTELQKLSETVRRLSTTEAGLFILDFFKKHVLRVGMDVLRQKVTRETAEQEMAALAATWDNFYTEILPRVLMVFHYVKTKDLPIKDCCLLSFRDGVLLQTGVPDTISFQELEPEVIPPAIIQLLLVLQNVKDGHPPSNNYLQVERVAGQVVRPYLGYLGLYDGTREPILPSNNPLPVRRLRLGSWEGDGDTTNDSLPEYGRRQSWQPGTQRTMTSRQNVTHPLETVTECVSSDSVRRHSVFL